MSCLAWVLCAAGSLATNTSAFVPVLKKTLTFEPHGDLLQELEKIMPSPKRPVDDKVGQEYESGVLEAVESLGLQADFLKEFQEEKVWRVKTQFGDFTLWIQNPHLLKLRAAYHERWQGHLSSVCEAISL